MEEFDISSEEYREVVFMLNGSVYRIDNPIKFLDDGNTHRVLDAQGVMHAYPAPGVNCLTAVRSKLREEKN